MEALYYFTIPNGFKNKFAYMIADTLTTLGPFPNSFVFLWK